MTKRERAIYETYKKSEMTSLRHLYATYSAAKERGWERCRRLCYDYAGKNLKILGGSSWQFSAGFEYEENSTPKFMYITAYGARSFAI